MRLEALAGLRARALVLAASFAVAVITVLLTPLAADAVVRTPTGLRCTIVGSTGRDVLTGTPGRDVICGRGGNDVIRGRGGNDVLVGGPGNDSLAGAVGKDLLYGGPGRDQLDGGSGNDRLLGGLDDDRLQGSDGNDVVAGAGGDDDLSGGPGGDVVDGGSGFNVCDVPGATDTQTRCAIDTARPVVANLALSPSVVDVSSAAQVIQVRAHVTDDTGVKTVQIGGSLASLASGTARDGIWATTVRVPRFVVPGPRELVAIARDRVGRDTFETRPAAYTVINTVYDTMMPVLQSLSLSTSSVDVRTAPRAVTATIRVTDDLAGPTDLYVCPAHALPTGTPSFRQAGGCTYMSKVSGTATDSTWKGTLTIPQGAPSGTWNVEIWISDAAGNFANDYWFGPDEVAARGTTTEPRFKAIPNGAGAFTVLGTTPDTNPPVLTSLTLSPSTVDTATGAVLVTADIAATDVEGVTAVGLFINGYAGYPDHTSWTDLIQITWTQGFQRIAGTAQNGIWRATFTVPGGTPDGTYFIEATVQDSAHFEAWTSSDSPSGAGGQVLTDQLAPTGTYFVVANSP